MHDIDIEFFKISVKEQTTIDYEGCPSADDDPADHYIITGKAVQIA